jgi:Mg2+ and Co2+ transporter CorA
MDVVEEMGRRIDQFDEELMTDKTSLTLETFYSIYHLKHDLLHLRILCNPLKDIIYRLQRTMQDNQFFICSHTEPLIRLDMSHHFVRQQISTYHTPKHTSGSLIHTAMCFANKSSKQSRRRRRTSSVFLNENIYIYFSDLNDHIHQLIDSLDVQRENVSTVISFWLALSRRETEEILKLLTLITAVFMPCLVLTGISSLNFVYGPYYNNQFGYFVVLGMLATIITSMITWYKLKRWF